MFYTKCCFHLYLLMHLLYYFIAGDEMFSDSYKMKLIDGVIYEVYGKLESRTQGDVKIEGFNPSAEEADEGTDTNCETGVDIVLNSRLVETYAFGDKKSYTLYLKDYMKKYVNRCFNSFVARIHFDKKKKKKKCFVLNFHHLFSVN